MNSIVNYLFESGISLGLFTTLYLLLLRQETFFRLNRYFLLFGLFFSFSLPLLHLRIYEPQPVMLGEVTVLPYRNMLATVSVYGTAVSERVVQTISTRTWLIVLYLCGFVFFSVRLLIRLLQIARLVRRGKIIREQGMKLVVLDQETGPFSFLSYVFVGGQLREQSGWQKILAHEFEHVRQGHSFDVLMLEVIAAFQWCNPFFWLLKRVLKENHEYLADQAVLKHEADPSFYKQVLLTRFIGSQMRMANNFNYSLIKKRINMMSKIKSSKLSNVKTLSGILTAIALIMVFACEQKEMVTEQEELPGNVSVSLADGGVLQLSGDSNAIQKLQAMLEKNPDIEMTAEGPGLKITPKSKDMGEVSVVGFGEQAAKQDPVFFTVEEMPEFPGGELALRKFIARGIKYPSAAREKGIQGKVYVNFVVEKDGSVGRMKIARGVDPSLDREALRVMGSLPRWEPGRQKGVPVAVSYTVPINFALQ
ncbi:MAG: M56 family metallopeptidase [Prolixibacteraceae bacterium]